MVKGVNKTVIEVNSTGSKVFDRIVFYVSPAYSNLNSRSLRRAVQNFTFQLDERAGRGYTSIRKKHIIRKRIVFSAVSVAALAVAIIVTAIIL